MLARYYIFAFVFFFTTSSFASRNPYSALFDINRCAAAGQWLKKRAYIEEQLRSQTVHSDFPYKFKYTFGDINGSDPNIFIHTNGYEKRVFPNFQIHQAFGFANVKEGKIEFAHLLHPTEEKYRVDEVPTDFEFWRYRNIDYLREQYEAAHLPPVTWEQMSLQESMLPEHRRMEITISKGDRLLFFMRLQAGTKPTFWPHETVAYGDDLPFVETSFESNTGAPFFFRRRTPTFFLPTDLIFSEPYSDVNPLNSIRSQHENDAIVEIGRTFIDKSADKQDLKAAAVLGYSAAVEVLRSLAIHRDLTRLVVIETATPLNARLYAKDFGMHELADITEFLGDSPIGDVYDILGRKFFIPLSDPALTMPEFKSRGLPPVRKFRSSQAGEQKVLLLFGRGDGVVEAAKESRGIVPLDFTHLVMRTYNLNDPNLIKIPLPDRSGWKFK